MTHYTEATVTLRFRSDAPLSYDDVRHRLQGCQMADLTEFVLTEWPHPATATWASMILDNQVAILKAIEQGLNGH